MSIENLSHFTYFWIGLILLFSVSSFIYVYLKKKKDQLLGSRRWIELLPSVASTLGVMGTFIGIAIGLYFFDPNQLDTSIPMLLGGLKTAFYTSIAGMLCSLFLSKCVSSGFDDKDKGISDADQAAGLIVDAVSQMRQQSEKQFKDQAAFYLAAGNILSGLKTEFEKVSTGIDSLAINMQAQVAMVDELKKEVVRSNESIIRLESTMVQAATKIENAANIIEASSGTTESLTGILTSILNVNEEQKKKLDESMETLSATSASILEVQELQKIAVEGILEENKAEHGDVTKMLDIIDATTSVQEEISSEVKTFGEKLHGEVLEIEDTIAKNKLTVEEGVTCIQEQLKINNNIAVENAIMISQNMKSVLDSLLDDVCKKMEAHAAISASILEVQELQKTAVEGILEENKAEHGDVTKMLDIIDATSSVQEEISTEVKSFGEKLHGEVLEIEDTIAKNKQTVEEGITTIQEQLKINNNIAVENAVMISQNMKSVLDSLLDDVCKKMDSTNKLLTVKFDEFAELLKKSNTEALVEVMKKVTEEFEKQMNLLIGKLIQENFEQLNKSVEQLNQWQMDNKQMIEQLTKHYQEMEKEFADTSTVLDKVSSNTKDLVSNGSKLHQLIDTLSKVLIEDEKFIKISKNLTDSANLTKENIKHFEKSTNQLEQWINKQRNFVDGVQMLVRKLDDLNKIRDYNDQFWKSTKQSMEEGVGIITEGSKALNKQLTQLDKQFYNRLSATLAELDTCIQAMVNSKD